MGATMITVDVIQHRLKKEIKAETFDIETMHRNVDYLYTDVLEAIAAGAPGADQLAKTVLQAELYRSSFWYA